MKPIKSLLGIPIDKLKKSRCYLTYEGAVKFCACLEGLEYWREREWGKIEAKDVFERFSKFCPVCFTRNIVSNLTWSPYCLLVSEREYEWLGDCYELCTCCDENKSKSSWKSASKKDKEKYVLLLRAVIIHAPKWLHAGDNV